MTTLKMCLRPKDEWEHLGKIRCEQSVILSGWVSFRKDFTDLIRGIRIIQIYIS